MKKIIEGQWYHVMLPLADEPACKMQRLKAVTVLETVVHFGKPKLGNPKEIVFVGSFRIDQVTWL